MVELIVMVFGSTIQDPTNRNIFPRDNANADQHYIKKILIPIAGH